MKGAGEDAAERRRVRRSYRSTGAIFKTRLTVGEAGRGVFRVPDGNLLEVLDAPEIAVPADRAQIEAGDAERLRPNLGIPAVEPPEIEVG